MDDKLDLTRFPEGLQRFAAQLIDILTAFDLANIGRHLELANSAPEGIGDEEYFEVLSAYSLVAYGEPGLDALYELARGDQSGSFWAPVALVAVAVGNSSVLTFHISSFARYLPDGAFEKIAKRVEDICRQ